MVVLGQTSQRKIKPLFYGMKPKIDNLLGRKPLNDAPYRNLGVVINQQGPGHHPLSDALCCRPDIMKNVQEFSHSI